MHPACAIFGHYELDHSIIKALPQVAELLNKNGIIATPLVASEQVLLARIKDSVCADHHNLEKFAGILQQLKSTQVIGSDIMNDYSKCLSSTNIIIYKL